MSDLKMTSDRWADDTDDEVPPLTRQQAQDFRDRHPQVNVWWVIAAQAAVGAVVAALAWLITGDRVMAASALYGAAVVLVPGALMARGASSRNGRLSPLVGAVSFMSWAVVKIGFSVLMLLLAASIVQPLSWPALLTAMVLCMQTYWLALLWRKR
jgi:ATP synthase protein I